MTLFYISAAKAEYDRKLDRIALRPYTTHSIQDFLDDIDDLENEVRLNPGRRKLTGAPPGTFRVGPSRTYGYSLIYRLHEGNAIILAVAAPERRPLYWIRRRS